MKFGMKSIAGAAALAFSVVGASAASAATTFDFTQGSGGGLGASYTSATPTTTTYYADIDANHQLGVAGASNNLLAKGRYTFTWDLSGNDNAPQPADTAFQIATYYNPDALFIGGPNLSIISNPVFRYTYGGVNSGTYRVTSQGGNTWLDSALYTTTGATAKLTLTSYTSAPEIDGGKVPLAMTRLGLLFVVSKRKRAGAIAAF